jgi:hypothetical protein
MNFFIQEANEGLRNHRANDSLVGRYGEEGRKLCDVGGHFAVACCCYQDDEIQKILERFARAAAIFFLSLFLSKGSFTAWFLSFRCFLFLCYCGVVFFQIAYQAKVPSGD